jgi:hypothetical protein
VDVYFLMDLSWSMRTAQASLASAGGTIISAIKQKTKNLTVGNDMYSYIRMQRF